VANSVNINGHCAWLRPIRAGGMQFLRTLISTSTTFLAKDVTNKIWIFVSYSFVIRSIYLWKV